MPLNKKQYDKHVLIQIGRQISLKTASNLTDEEASLITPAYNTLEQQEEEMLCATLPLAIKISHRFPHIIHAHWEKSRLKRELGNSALGFLLVMHKSLTSTTPLPDEVIGKILFYMMEPMVNKSCSKNNFDIAQNKRNELISNVKIFYYDIPNMNPENRLEYHSVEKAFLHGSYNEEERELARRKIKPHSFLEKSSSYCTIL